MAKKPLPIETKAIADQSAIGTSQLYPDHRFFSWQHYPGIGATRHGTVRAAGIYRWMVTEYKRREAERLGVAEDRVTMNRRLRHQLLQEVEKRIVRDDLDDLVMLIVN